MNIGYPKFAISVRYRRPSYPSVFVDELHGVLSYVVTCHTSASAFSLGDVNYPSILRPFVTSTSLPHNTEHCGFLNLCSAPLLSRLITCSTRVADSTANTLDIVLTLRLHLTSPLACLPCTRLRLATSFGIRVHTNNTLEIRNQIREYRKGDFNAIDNEQLLTALLS